jgi:Curli production assembly/transport component CsgG
MNPKPTNQYSKKFALQLFSLLALALLPTGCQILFGSGNTQSAPPPQATWTPSPDFSAEAITKIAIISEDATQSGGGRDPFMTTIEDQFITAALQKGYKVSSRSDVDRVLQEIHFQQSGLTEGDAAKLGRMLNVPAVLIVRITSASVNVQQTGVQINYQTQYSYTSLCDMSARLISVEKAEILGIGSSGAARATNNQNNKGPAMYYAAKALAAALPSRISPQATSPK